MSDSYYDQDYYMSGNKSGYGGKFLPYTDGLNLIFRRDLARKIKSAWDPKNMLEIGCATGILSQVMREFGVEAYGIDISNWAIENSNPSIRPFLTVGDITVDLQKYKDQEFDLVTAMDVLEHIEKKTLPRVIGEICRIAKQQIMIEVPIKDNGVDSSHVSILPSSWWCTQFTTRKFRVLGAGTSTAPDDLINFQASFTRRI
jgi:ubiquinone/menaquinone biosynthesis C-methylase UbiE